MGVGSLSLFMLLVAASIFGQNDDESGSGSGQDSEVPAVEYLDKFELGMSNDNVSPVCLQRRLDGISKPIPVTNGFPLGDSVHNRAYVGTNGIISFERGFYFWYPYPFPTPWWSVRKRHVIAPFWSDNDIRIQGDICYEVHEGNTDYLKLVNDYISVETNTDFRGTWMLLAEWDNVHPYPHGSANSWWWNWYSNKLKTFTDLKNTYQGIVITDGVTSYSLSTYKCDEMQWSGYWRHATIGYNAGGDHYKNHPLTGYSQVKDIGCNGPKSDKIHNILYQLTLSPDYIQQKKSECLKKLREDEDLYGSDIESFASNLQPCPCSWWQGWRDRRFRFDWNAWYSGNLCYHDRFPGFNDGSQYCCYKRGSPGWGSLERFREPGKYGTNMLRHHPRFSADYNSERELRETCCTVGLCDVFYDRRVQNDCGNYIPPPRTWGWGDPHITNIDSFSYTFNGLGEYRMIEIDSDVFFHMQGRTAKVNANINATEFVALAFYVPSNEIIEIQNVNSSYVMYHNGTNISYQVSTVNDTYSNINETIEVTRVAEQSMEIVFSSGISVTVNISVGILHYTIVIPNTYANLTQGLLGNFNGISNDDIVSPNGTVYNSSDEKEIYMFGETWKVPDVAHSLFVSPDPDPDPSFVPGFVGDVTQNVSAEILDACGTDIQCVYDAVQTGDVNIGLATSNIQQNITNDIAQINNFPPVMNGNATLNVMEGEVTLYTFTVTDTDNYTVLVDVPSLITDYKLTRDNNEWTYEFTWTIDDTLNFMVTFIATDTFNSSSILQPKISICACLNNGNCTYDGVNSFDNPVIQSCNCVEEVWSGDFCEDDIDGCEDFMCYPEVQCIDNPAPMSGASCGDCPMGFFGTGFMCDDIDECENGTDNCQQQCVNTEGSFLCECYSGFKFDSNVICQDINECIVFNDCHQECTNTIGSYQCSCIDGFVLETDNVSCTAKEPCTNSYTLPLLCGLLDGIEVFACFKGYTYDSNTAACEDKNECLLSACEQNCSNTDGSFTCSCTSGYELAADGRYCLDTDECLEAALNNQNLCDDSELCNNIPGSYMCRCPGGTEYNLTSQTCIVIKGSTSTTNSPSSTATTSPPNTIPPPVSKSPILSLEVIIGIAVGAAFVLFVFFIFIGFVLHTLYKKKSVRSRKIKVLPRPQDLTHTRRDAKEPLRLVSINTSPPHYVTD